MNGERLNTLIWRHLDGSLTADEQAELERELARSAEARELFWRETDFHAALWSASQMAGAQTRGERERVRLGGAKPRGTGLRVLAKKRHRTSAIKHAALAAALLVICAIGIVTQFFSKKPVGDTAAIAALRGQYTLTSASGQPKANSQQLAPGDRIELRPDSEAELHYADQTRVVLRGKTLLSNITTARGKELKLEGGEAVFEVAPQPPDTPFKVHAQGLVTEVLGTKFTIRVAGETTRLEVHEGRVRASNAQGKTAVLTSLEYVEASGQSWVHARAEEPSAAVAGFEDVTYTAEDIPENYWNLEGLHRGIDFGEGQWANVKNTLGAPSLIQFAAKDAQSATFEIPPGMVLRRLVFAAEGGGDWSLSDGANPELRGSLASGTRPVEAETKWLRAGRTIRVRFSKNSLVGIASLTYGLATETTLNKSSVTGRVPFLNQPNTVPGSVEAEGYDMGGQGVAYLDLNESPGHQHNLAIRTRDEQVELLGSRSASAKVYLAATRAGEWLAYTIAVKQAGKYDIGIVCANNGEGAAFHATLNGKNISGALQPPHTVSGWSIDTEWRTVTLSNVELPAGEHDFRLYFDANNKKGSSGFFDVIHFKLR